MVCCDWLFWICVYVVILTAYQGNSATSLLETQRWPNAERIEESFDYIRASSHFQNGNQTALPHCHMALLRGNGIAIYIHMWQTNNFETCNHVKMKFNNQCSDLLNICQGQVLLSKSIQIGHTGVYLTSCHALSHNQIVCTIGRNRM